LSENENPPNHHKLKEFDEWTLQSVNIILNNCADCNTMIVGSSDTFYDCLLIGCLRRVQEWSFVSILSEFRENTWPNKLFDLEQYIEHFNIPIIDTKKATPDHLLTHYHLKAEEVKLIQRYSNQVQIYQKTNQKEEENEWNHEKESVSIEEESLNNTVKVADQRMIDEMLIQLLFNHRNTLISSSVTFDPNLSLINDKDEDD